MHNFCGFDFGKKVRIFKIFLGWWFSELLEFRRTKALQSRGLLGMYTTTMNCKVEENPYLCVEEEQLKILKGRCAANVNMK